MNLNLKRKYKGQSYTIGDLYINGKLFSNTLEDVDRGLNDSMSLDKIKELKKPSITAIPTGTYTITLDIVSPKFGSKPFYKEVCNGKLPRLLNVKGFEGILIHVGEGANGANLTEGCILVGKNTIKGGLTESKETFKKLYNILVEAKRNRENIFITIE